MSNNILYHYTSLEVFKLILKSRKLRFTELVSLNDKSEYKHGIKLLKDRIQEYEYNNNVKNKFDVTLLDRFSFMDSLCSISFTENKDDYLFWNSYYVPKNGSIAIGFNKTNLFTSDFAINKCIYGNPYPEMGKDRYIWFRAIFDLHNLYQIHKNREYIHITLQTAHIKNENFRLENEWRSVAFLPKENACTFERNGNKIKCHDQFFNLDSIFEIVIGPSSTQEQTYNEVQNIVSEYKIDCKIQNSTIPLEL